MAPICPFIKLRRLLNGSRTGKVSLILEEPRLLQMKKSPAHAPGFFSGLVRRVRRAYFWPASQMKACTSIRSRGIMPSSTNPVRIWL